MITLLDIYEVAMATLVAMTILVIITTAWISVCAGRRIEQKRSSFVCEREDAAGPLQRGGHGHLEVCHDSERHRPIGDCQERHA